ncbi:Outer membrane protein assembly factor YaeT [Sandaracinus amylolyticus]|nr:Outer membrane protein assembly factor YaeT [Sandaracinus amylolyticus]
MVVIVRSALLAWLLLVAVLVAPARADVPSELAGRPIAELTIEGGATESELADAGLVRGERLDRRRVRDAIAHLLASGRWADVQIDAAITDGGVALSVRLTPRIVITRIELRGNSAIDDDELRASLRVREGGELEPGELPAMAEAAQELYASRGFVRADVSLRLRDTDDPARKVLLAEVVENEPMRVRGVVWDGAEDAPETEHAWDELGLHDGDVLDRRRLDEGVRRVETRLREHGWLEARLGEPALQPAERGVVIHVPLELGRHYRVELHGHAPVDEDTVNEVLHLADEPLGPPVISAVRERIVEVYRRHGFHRASVEIRRTRDPQRIDQRRAALLSIEVTPGTQLQVIGVSFPGASHFETDFLRDQIDSYLEEDLPSPELFWPVDSEVVDRIGLSGQRTRARRQVPADVEVVPARIWFEPTYAEAASHIQELYQAAGFLAARVGTPELRELEDDRAVVVVPVFEGPRTLVYDVRVHGNEIAGTRELLDAAQIARGDAFGYLPLEQARRRVRDLYAERGHLFARVDPQVRFSPDGERAEIVFEIVERFPVHVGEIRIEGATSTDLGLVRDVVALRSGDLYRPSQARESEERLRTLGVFASVNVAPADPDLAERVKPVIVTVSERDPQVVGLSAGFATGEGARGTFEYQYRNLLGLALTLTLRIQLAYQLFFQDQELEESITQLSALNRLERRITVGIGVPWIPGLPNVRGALDLAHIRDNERDFGYDKNGITLSFTWVPERVFALTLSGEIEHNGIQLFDQRSLQELLEDAIERGDVRAQRLLRVPQGNTAIGSTRLTGSLDLRDNPFTPTRGIFAAGGMELVHSIASEQLPPQEGLPPQPPFFSNFLKLTLGLSGYVPITEGWVLALQARGGIVAHLETGSQTYPNRAFYMGGVDTLRGFLQDQVIPEDQARLVRESGIDPVDITRTGDLFYLFRSELRFPIVDALQGGVFLDVGNVWAVVSNVDELAVRWSAGLGLRIATPVGPIALDYGFNLDRREDLGEPFGSLHFSIGLF